MILKDKGILLFNLTVKRFELNLVKSISESESLLFENTKIDNSQLTPFKDFLNFNTNRLKLSVVVTEKKNINIDFSISNIFLFDNDYDYIHTEEEIMQVVKKPHLNREFCVFLIINVVYSRIN